MPECTEIERLIDGLTHFVGVSASGVAVAVLMSIVIPTGDVLSIIAAAVYSAGLVAMMALSAANNLTVRADRRAMIRPYDHAAIFLMIAGTYTPFALISIGGRSGHSLLAVVWVAAIAGMLLKLLRPGQFERSSMVMYVALGWAGLPVAGLLIAALPTSALVLLGAGGLLYTSGVAFHLWRSLPYHNAVWHGFVLAGAGCHYVAVVIALTG